jgi:hypothetical protein
MSLGFDGRHNPAHAGTHRKSVALFLDLEDSALLVVISEEPQRLSLVFLMSYTNI